MNALRTPPRETKADRQGLTHVSSVIERLLAKYGITDELAPAKPSLPPQIPTAPIGQQTFPWFESSEVNA